VPALPAKPVDATGAGDNFLAGFVASLLDGKSTEECCRFGSAVAKLVVETVGAKDGLKNRDQVQQVLNQFSSK
jgi:sugar/nucleoside kinase (ribokinase family)